MGKVMIKAAVEVILESKVLADLINLFQRRFLLDQALGKEWSLRAKGD